MSAPDTNTEKQARRHKPAIGGIAIALTVAAALFLTFIAWTLIQGNTPEGSEDQVDGRTGAVEETVEQ